MDTEGLRKSEISTDIDRDIKKCIIIHSTVGEREREREREREKERER